MPLLSTEMLPYLSDCELKNSLSLPPMKNRHAKVQPQVRGNNYLPGLLDLSCNIRARISTHKHFGFLYVDFLPAYYTKILHNVRHNVGLLHRGFTKQYEIVRKEDM